MIVEHDRHALVGTKRFLTRLLFRAASFWTQVRRTFGGKRVGGITHAACEDVQSDFKCMFLCGLVDQIR